jgi:hypothetical protein
VKARVPVLETMLVLIGAALLIFFGVVREERNMPNLDSYSSYDARSGGYRAWYELMQREGVNVGRFERHWVFLDRSIATLVCAAPLDRAQLGGSAAAAPTGPTALAAWVKDGGTVVTLGGFPPYKAGGKDALLAEHEPFDALVYHAVAGGESGSKGINEATMGHGKILYVKDESAFTNGRIGDGNAARLAYLLARPTRSGATAFEETLHGHLIPEHWWQAAPRRLTAALIGAFVVLSIALLGTTVRLGPPIVAPRRREATSAEYLDAVASLYARADAKRKVLQDITNSVRRAVRRSEAWQGELEDRGEIGALRTALLELEKLAVAPKLSERAFVQGMATAQRLRKEAMG